MEDSRAGQASSHRDIEPKSARHQEGDGLRRGVFEGGPDKNYSRDPLITKASSGQVSIVFLVLGTVVQQNLAGRDGFFVADMGLRFGRRRVFGYFVS